MDKKNAPQKSLKTKETAKGHNIFRLLDANLNRCREGLRVLEDTVRFVGANAKLFEQLRSQRHALDRLTREYYPQLLKARDSQTDPGERLSESKRTCFEAVIFANFRRCEESLRVLEEYGKLFSGMAHVRFKKMRFKMYGLEKQVVSETL
jgi:thiamine-phosphate pyrophosphorylase